MFYVLVFIGVAAVLWLLSGGSGGRGFRVGRVIEDYEARLRPPQHEGPTWMAAGKAEREQRADGVAEFELSCIGIRPDTGTPRIPAGATVDVVVGGTVLATVPVTRGRIRLKLRSDRGAEIPPVQEGTPVAIRYEGTVLLEGVFERD